MNFAKGPGGPVTHAPPAKALPPEPPFEEPIEEKVPELPPVLGPADSTRPGVDNPFSVEAPGLDVPSLAAALNWALS